MKPSSRDSWDKQIDIKTHIITLYNTYLLTLMYIGPSMIHFINSPTTIQVDNLHYCIYNKMHQTISNLLLIIIIKTQSIFMKVLEYVLYLIEMSCFNKTLYVDLFIERIVVFLP